jgi:hypothetical protein
MYSPILGVGGDGSRKLTLILEPMASAIWGSGGADARMSLYLFFI